jgi:hypothetical protein
VENAELGNYARSRAVLIGNSIQAVHDVLTDSDIGCWPSDRVTVIEGPSDPAELSDRLHRLAMETQDVFLLYFVGQGGTNAYGLEYTELLSVYRHCPARIQLAFLDCCYPEEVTDSTEIFGVYTLTASSASFTDELVKALRVGIPRGPAVLTPDKVYWELRTQMARRGLPGPELSGEYSVGGFSMARNGALSARLTAARFTGPGGGNLIMLDTTSPFPDRVTKAVELWLSTGRRGDGLVTGIRFEMMYCWFLRHSDRGLIEFYKRHGETRCDLVDSPDVQEYVEACLSSFGGKSGWRATLQDHVSCLVCGMTYRVENILICTGCVEYYCYECKGDHLRRTGHEIVG